MANHLIFHLVRKRLAYLFLIIFSFQVLPVKEVGGILFKGLMTEEIHETLNGADENPSAKNKKRPETLDIVHSHVHFESRIQTAMQCQEHLPSPFVPDIPTPPPNRIS